MTGVAAWFSKMFAKFFIKLLPLFILLGLGDIIGGEEETTVPATTDEETTL